jgi:hypothetical protein
LVWRAHGAKADDTHWRRIPTLLLEAVSPPRSPQRWDLHSERANVTMEILKIVGPRLDPAEAMRYQAKIVEATRTAARLNPTNAELHARLAEASAAIAMYQDAGTEAAEALRLDRLTPHRDRKLREQDRKRLEAQVPQWAESAAKLPIKGMP